MNTIGNQPNKTPEFSRSDPQPFNPEEMDRGIGFDNTSPTRQAFGKGEVTSPKVDLNSWTDYRIAIYSSLDEALSKHVTDALGALGDLRRQVEEESSRITQKLRAEQTELQSDVKTLREERNHLYRELEQLRQELDRMNAFKLTFQTESVSSIIGLRTEQTNLANEVSGLTRQIQEMGQQIQLLLKRKPDEVWASYSTGITTGIPTSADAPPMMRPPSVGTSFPNPFYSGMEKKPGTYKPGDKEPVEKPYMVPTTNAAGLTDYEKMRAMDLQEFSDAPTPNFSALRPPVAPANKVQAVVPPPLIEPAREKVEERPPQPIQPAPKSIISQILEAEDLSDDGGPAERPALLRQSEQAEQHAARLFGRRFPEVGAKAADATGKVENGQATSGIDHTQQTRSGRRANDKALMADIGNKLGLEDVKTPPPASAIRYAPGFAPPPGDEEASLVGSMDEIFLTPRPFQLGNIADETPPFIGDLGPDFAQQWNSTQLNNMGPPTASQARPPFNVDVPPAHPIKPPPAGGINGTSENGNKDVTTKVTISNLQGLSLLKMEKVLQGLPGVRHVTVTDFRKGELVLEVRHQDALKLDNVLPGLPDMKLQLISSENGLAFSQIR